MNENEDKQTRKRRLAKERYERWYSKQSQESLAKINEQKNKNRKLQHANLTPEEAEAHRASHAASQRQYIENMNPEQAEVHRTSHAASQRQYVENMNPEQAEAHCASHAASQRQYVENMNPEQAEAHRTSHAASQRQYIENMNPEQAEAHRTSHAASQRQYFENMNPEQAEAHRASHAGSQRQYVENMNPEQAEAHRASHAASQRQYVENMNQEQAEAHRASHAASQQRYIENMDLNQAEAYRASHASSQRRYVENMNPEQAVAYHAANASANALAQERRIEAARREAINFDESTIAEHSCGPFNVRCIFCNSKNFIDERPSDGKFTSCCQKGKVMLPLPKNVHGETLKYPDFLKEMLSDPYHPLYKNFREHIRSYNSAMSFASMGAKIVDLPGTGPYVFKIHGQTYHRTCHIQPPDGETPKYAQLYVLDSSTQATDIRCGYSANEKCKSSILKQLDLFFRENNRLTQSYMLMHEIESKQIELAIQRGEQIPIISMAFKRDRQSDQRRYNEPTSNEVAMVFVNEDGEPPFERDIHVYPRNPQDPDNPFISINILSPNLDPMSYPLLYVYGEPGWQPNWQYNPYPGAQLNRVRNSISMLQYKVAQTAIRDEFNPVMSVGKLTQQWLVDSYLQVEANNLNYIRHHQKKLRVEQYQGLADHIADAEQNHLAPGISVILPSSFEGSPRNMRERCCDAMSIFSKFGAPDLFITFTANPKWTEIVENLRPGEQACDRPDLVARVFKIKLDSLMRDLTKNHVLGHVEAFVYSIEFQKRGLPHVHILLTLKNQDKFTTTEKIDQVVCAEIPSTEKPRIREIILRCNMHGPCGTQHPNAPCMKDGFCSKNFPKSFNERTIPNVNGYAIYRRRINEQVNVRNVLMDNSRVVPYNPYLSLKYNAHINVEICTSLRAVKYLYKYIFKGYDCANLAITNNVNGETENRTYNEITNFINCRYVSAPEAIWRLREHKMHDRSHAIMRIPIHLPNNQAVYFEEGREEEALNAAQDAKTKLIAWFELNSTDTDARQWLYTEIPSYYIFKGNKWQKRQRGADKIISRMYTVSIKDEERFFMRMLLLHVRGAQSFEDLRTVNGITYETFKSAAIAKGLLESDAEWDHCLSDSATFQMPKQMRELFAYICVFAQPSQPLKLWNDHIIDMTLDYTRNDLQDIAINKALHHIESILKQHSLSCALLGLPLPTGTSPFDNEEQFNQLEEERDSEERITKLNDKQFQAFQQIIAAVNNENAATRCFYVDGPGGSGKTFLYSTLLSFIRGRGEIALAFATTGIAATLLKGGRTLHSGFKLPVPLLDTSVSSMRLTSPEADVIRRASLIVIDEITMLPKNGLRCIEKLLREIHKSEKPFGGAVIVIGGDFRQTLPVVPRGTRTEIFEVCIKSSPLWSKFTHLTLIDNMRSDGQHSHNKWLLRIGSGDLPRADGIYEEDTIEIPNEMIGAGDIIEKIFSDLTMDVTELAKRVIVAPTNMQTLEINRKIIDKLPGEAQIYYSADSIVSEDPNDTLNFPVEFLNEQTPSGMPPHCLLLKKEAIVMLLRNLNPKKGLCNGTRLIIKELSRNIIKASILSACHQNEEVIIPRIDLAPTDTTLPFILRRRQFPVTPAYAITINKSQGQSFDHVGISLDTPVFAHGQLYVALSRSRVASQVKVFIKPNAQQGRLLKDDRIFTKNVVYKEVLN